MKVLITSGGTKVPIDSVRHIGNMSSGTFGARIGYGALKAGHDVTFLMAKGSKSPLGMRFDENDSIGKISRKVASNIRDRILYGRHIRLAEYSTFEDYKTALEDETRTGNYAVVVLAAAVSDYDVLNKVYGKMRTKAEEFVYLTPLPKLISHFKKGLMRRPTIVVGFKLMVNSEQEELCATAQKSLVDNDCDLIVANDLRDIKANRHQLILVDRKGIEFKFTRPDDPNYLAREVVRKYTCLYHRS